MARNDQVFERLQRLQKAKKMTELTIAIKQVAFKAAGSEKDEAPGCISGGFPMFYHVSPISCGGFELFCLNLVPFGHFA